MLLRFFCIRLSPGLNPTGLFATICNGAGFERGILSDTLSNLVSKSLPITGVCGDGLIAITYSLFVEI